MKELLLALGGTGVAVWFAWAVRLRFRRRYSKGKPRWDIDVEYNPSRLLRLPRHSDDQTQDD